MRNTDLIWVTQPGDNMSSRQIPKVFFPTALATILLGASVTSSHAETIKVKPSSSPGSVTVKGQSGGSVDSLDCGFVAEAPNQVLQVSERINYMRVNVQVAGGKPTLLVDGPDGRFCVFANDITDGNPEISGVWLPGKYKIYVGDRTDAQHQYTLSISQQKNPPQ
jgi:hypothetical protein